MNINHRIDPSTKDSKHSFTIVEEYYEMKNEEDGMCKWHQPHSSNGLLDIPLDSPFLDVLRILKVPKSMIKSLKDKEITLTTGHTFTLWNHLDAIDMFLWYPQLQDIVYGKETV